MGTKWSLNLVIYSMHPQTALLDLESGNYISSPRSWRRCDFSPLQIKDGMTIRDFLQSPQDCAFILPLASLSFTAPWINELRNQVQKEEQHCVYLPIELFQEVSVSKAWRNVMWQQSLCHLSRCSFSENIPARPLGRADSSPLSLLHNHSSVQDSGWVLLLPATALWKQPNLQHTLTLACPHVNTCTHTRAHARTQAY